MDNYKAQKINDRVSKMNDLKDCIQKIEEYDSVKQGIDFSIVEIARKLGINEDLIQNPAFLEEFTRHVTHIINQETNQHHKKSDYHNGNHEYLVDKIFFSGDKMPLNEVVQILESSHFLYSESQEQLKLLLNSNEEMAQRNNNGIGHTAMRVDEEGNYYIQFYNINRKKMSYDYVSVAKFSFDEEGNLTKETMSSSKNKNNNEWSPTDVEITKFDQYGIDISLRGNTLK